jgi:hypothetical protein
MEVYKWPDCNSNRKRDVTYRKFAIYITPVTCRILYLSIVVIGHPFERILNRLYEIVSIRNPSF